MSIEVNKSTVFSELKGYHGTATGMAEKIEIDGYKASTDDISWLGQGVYFFRSSSGSVEIDGLNEAKSWVISVKKYHRWVIFEAKIISAKFLDLVDNIEHRKYYEIARGKMLEMYDRQKKPRNALRDFIVFKYIDEQNDFDFIRALVDAGRQEYSSFIVKRPQIQICVKQMACITENNIISRG